MRSWKPWFAARVERQRRARRIRGGAVVAINYPFRGLPEQGPIFPLGGPLTLWQHDLIRRIEAERVLRRERRRL